MAKYANISVISTLQLQTPYSDDLDSKISEMCDYLRKNIEQVLPDKPDLIIMPEQVDRFISFTPEQRMEYWRYRGNRIRDFLAEIARDNHCYIAYSSARYLPDDPEYPFRNSTQLIDRNGEIVGIYDKNNLVPTEHDIYQIQYGTEAPVFELDFGKVACVICFDLNYRELRERYAAQKPDLIVFCSMLHGSLMQQSWAYDCRAYFAGAIGNGQRSRILNPMGTQVSSSSNLFNHTTCKINLDYAVVHTEGHHNFHLPKIQNAKKKYGELLQVYDPEGFDAVLLTYEGIDKTLRDVMNEFDIIDMDEYLDQCRAHHLKSIHK